MANPLFDPLRADQPMEPTSPAGAAPSTSTKRLVFERPGEPVDCLRYETDEDARVREFLSSERGFGDDFIDVLLRNYHEIGRARAKLGIK